MSGSLGDEILASYRDDKRLIIRISKKTTSKVVPVGGFLSHGEPLKFLVVWGCFQGHFIQVDEDSIGNWTFGFFLLVAHLIGCMSQPISRK